MFVGLFEPTLIFLEVKKNCHDFEDLKFHLNEILSYSFNVTFLAGLF